MQRPPSASGRGKRTAGIPTPTSKGMRSGTVVTASTGNLSNRRAPVPKFEEINSEIEG